MEFQQQYSSSRAMSHVGGMTICIVLLLSLLPCIARAQVTPRLIPAVFIFGDSLSDPGNNNYFRTLSRANNPPNGIDFPGGYATGRYCNGRTTVDIIGKLNCSIDHKLPMHIHTNT